MRTSRASHRSDLNQRAIVDALRAAGCSVEIISHVGRGVPDLLTGMRGRNFLVEVKQPNKTLTDDQIRWQNRWRGGRVYVLRTVEDAMAFVAGEP